MHERLSALVPPPPPRPPGVVPPTPVDELTRILALPRRLPYDCTRNPVTKRYVPRTQALVEHETAKYARALRVSCACRPRRVTRLNAETLVITRVLPLTQSEPPQIVALADFVRDCRGSAAEDETRRKIQGLAVGDTFELPSADGSATGHPCVIELNPTQAWILNEAAQVGGIVGYCAAGSGKSFAWLLAPLAFPDGRLAVLCIEPKQRRHYRAFYLRLREHFRVPTIVFDNDEALIVEGTVPLHLVSYSVLSLTVNSDLLDRKAPDILILDEAHRATGDSAINRRVKRYVAGKIHEREAALARGEAVRARAVRLLDGSGTFENKSVQDTQMLCTYSLGTGSPLPNDPDEAVALSAIIDPSYRPDRESKLAVRLHQVFGDGSFNPNDDSFADLLVSSPESPVRRGFCKWRMETLGIVTSSSAAIGASIYFGMRKAPKIPKEIAEALALVRAGSRPDGDEFDDQMHQVSCAREVAVGFYQRWIFPKHPCAAPPICSPRCAQCLLIDDWFAKRRLYKKAERSKLRGGELRLDSPELVRAAAERAEREPKGGPLSLVTYCVDCWRGTAARPSQEVAWPCLVPGHRPAWRCLFWAPWRDIENQVEHQEQVKWLSDYLAADAAKWAKDNTGVVWFRSTPFGRRVAELSGLPYFNGGPGCEERLNNEKGDRSIICSIKALGAGTDGLQQKFPNALVAEMPASNGGNEGAEQILARLHRQGQPADVVRYEGYFHVSELMDALRQVMVEAEWNKEMTNNPQRILLADMDVPGL